MKFFNVILAAMIIVILLLDQSFSGAQEQTGEIPGAPPRPGSQ